MHAQLDHPNVIPFLGVFKENDEDEPPMIVLPFMESGSAMDFLNQLENAEAEVATSSIVGQLIFTPGAMLTYNYFPDVRHK